MSVPGFQSMFLPILDSMPAHRPRPQRRSRPARRRGAGRRILFLGRRTLAGAQGPVRHAGRARRRKLADALSRERPPVHPAESDRPLATRPISFSRPPRSWPNCSTRKACGQRICTSTGATGMGPSISEREGVVVAGQARAESEPGGTDAVPLRRRHARPSRSFNPPGAGTNHSYVTCVRYLYGKGQPDGSYDDYMAAAVTYPKSLGMNVYYLARSVMTWGSWKDRRQLDRSRTQDLAASRALLKTSAHLRNALVAARDD
jgi:hypothetical protein